MESSTQYQSIDVLPKTLDLRPHRGRKIPKSEAQIAAERQMDKRRIYEKRVVSLKTHGKIDDDTTNEKINILIEKLERSLPDFNSCIINLGKRKDGYVLRLCASRYSIPSSVKSSDVQSLFGYDAICPLQSQFNEKTGLGYGYSYWIKREDEVHLFERTIEWDRHIGQSHFDNFTRPFSHLWSYEKFVTYYDDEHFPPKPSYIIEEEEELYPEPPDDFLYDDVSDDETCQFDSLSQISYDEEYWPSDDENFEFYEDDESEDDESEDEFL
jgi:hypothetical protein